MRKTTPNRQGLSSVLHEKKLFRNDSLHKTLILGDIKTNKFLIVERPCILLFCSSFYRVMRVTCMIARRSRNFDGHCCMRNLLQWFSKTVALSFSTIISGRRSAIFPVAIKTPGIYVNCSLVDEVTLFGMISNLFGVFVKFTATLLLDSRKENQTRSLVSDPRFQDSVRF